MIKVKCPISHCKKEWETETGTVEEIEQKLKDHLMQDHSKEELLRLVVIEYVHSVSDAIIGGRREGHRLEVITEKIETSYGPILIKRTDPNY